MKKPLFPLLAWLLGFLHATARAENWPQWRGPNGDGTSPERDLPLKWSRTENLAWRLELPGPAGSTPAIWGDRLFVTTPVEDDLHVLCVSRDGKELWRRKVAAGNKDYRRDEGNSAAPSPSTDGKHVWAFFGTGHLACFDFEGKLAWESNLAERYGAYDHWHGYSSTPLLAGDSLFQMCLRMKDPYVVALDKATGKERWKVARESDAEHESRHSYASPVSKPGLVVVPSAKGNPLLGVRPDGKGDVTATHVAWRRGRDTTDVPTPVIHDGIVYNLRENGVLIALDEKTGEEQYLQRIHSTRQRASPVVADGKLYVASRDGVVYVIRPGRKFELLAENGMEEPMASTPAIAGGRIYLRTFKALYAVEGGKPAR